MLKMELLLFFYQICFPFTIFPIPVKSTCIHPHSFSRQKPMNSLTICFEILIPWFTFLLPYSLLKQIHQSIMPIVVPTYIWNSPLTSTDTILVKPHLNHCHRIQTGLSGPILSLSSSFSIQQSDFKKKLIESCDLITSAYWMTFYYTLKKIQSQVPCPAYRTSSYFHTLIFYHFPHYTGLFSLFKTRQPISYLNVIIRAVSSIFNALYRFFSKQTH